MIKTLESIQVVAENWTKLNEYAPPHDSRKLTELYTTQNGFNIRVEHSEEECNITQIIFSNDLSQWKGSWDYTLPVLKDELTQKLFSTFKEEIELEQHLGGNYRVYSHKDEESTELKVYDRFMKVEKVKPEDMEEILTLIHEVGKKNFESGNLTIIRPSSKWKKGEWA